MPAGALLQVRDLAVEFKGPNGTVRAVDDVSFDLAAGERLAIVGESGSGKSVLSASLMQLVPHPGRIVGGSVKLDASTMVGDPKDDLLHGGKDSDLLLFAAKSKAKAVKSFHHKH